MVEIINSFEDLCRLCAGKIDILMGINIFESDNRQIFKKICVCLPIQISVDDSFPKMVCVECACKLDLMFDFRERSLMTAHLFSDMMSNGNVIAVHQDIQINEEPEVIANDFMSCKLAPVKYTAELNSEICAQATDNILHQNNMVLQENSDQSKKEVKNESIMTTTKSSNIFEYRKNKLVSQLKDPTPLEKEPSTAEKMFLPPEKQTLERTITNEDISTVNVESNTVNPNDICQHVNDCPGINWFFCSTCSESFSGKEELDRHNHEHLPNEKPKGEGFSEEVLNAEVPPNEKKKTKEKRGSKGTKEGEKKSESKVCTECGKQYQTNYKLQEHMRKHTGEKPYTCSYQDCKKAFRSKIGLAQHEANHSGQFEFACSTCGKGFQCKSYLVVHQRVHSDLKPYVCKQCSSTFKTKQSLLDHMNRHLGVKPFLCDICGRGFITKGLCKSHQKVHSGIDNRQYPCNVCRKLFVSKSYLNTHFRIHTGEKPFMCEVCGKGFLTRVDLRIHSTMHTGEKSFVCEMCGKAFARRDALRCHRRSHTGERPYKCEYCGQSFTQFSSMAIHKRLHTGERPYECDVCHKAFVSRSTMKSHKKKHHATNNETDSNFQFVTVEVPQEELNGRVEQVPQQLVVIENSSQLLLALSKRHPTNETLKMKNESAGVAAIIE